MKNIVLLIIAFFIISCSTAHINIEKNFTNHSHPTCYLDIPDDPWGYTKDISNHFENLGFAIVKTKNDKPDILASVSYSCHWDVFYRTFKKFDMTIRDAKTGKVLAKSNYVGRFGFNSCKKALKLVFKKLKKNLNI